MKPIDFNIEIDKIREIPIPNVTLMHETSTVEKNQIIRMFSEFYLTNTFHCSDKFDMRKILMNIV